MNLKHYLCSFLFQFFSSVFLLLLNSNNLDNQQRLRSPKRSTAISPATPENEVKSNQDDIKYSNRIDIYSDGTDSGVKINDEQTSEDDRPPRLPPRPPPRPRNTVQNETGKGFSFVVPFISIMQIFIFNYFFKLNFECFTNILLYDECR